MKKFAKKTVSTIHYLTHNTLVLINALLSLCMVLGCLSTVVPAGHLCILPYFGLFFPFWLGGTMAFLCYWALRRKRVILLPLLTILLCFGNVRNTFSLPLFSREKANDSNVSIMTLNTFGLRSRQQMNKVRELVFEQEADIVCLQEFGGESDSRKLNRLIEDYEEKYPYHHIWYKTQGKNFWMGNAVFSKYPIVNKAPIYYESRYNISIYSDIAIGNDTIRLINNHLESFKFTPHEIAQFKDAIGNQSEELKSSTIMLWKKMNDAYRLRGPQADSVAAVVTSSPYPVVLCGDFNDVPQSYAYHRLKGKKLMDLGNKAGWGYRHTYYRHYMLVNIDHILIDKHFLPTSYKVLHTELSDHYPVVGSFNLRK